jgi:hypothetical protein
MRLTWVSHVVVLCRSEMKFLLLAMVISTAGELLVQISVHTSPGH